MVRSARAVLREERREERCARGHPGCSDRARIAEDAVEMGNTEDGGDNDDGRTSSTEE